MRTGNKNYTLKELEHLFAENFNSPAFPILADYYFNISQLNKALKVCQVGLKNSPNNLAGQYILAKIYIMKNQHIKAEKLLKHIISFDKCNAGAITTLIRLETLLKRSPKTINNYIISAYKKIPNNKKIKKAYKQLNKKQGPKKEYKVKSYTKTIKLTKRLATKTMFNILLVQKKYDEAIKVLELMSLNKRNKSFIEQARKKILTSKKIKG